MEAGSKKSWEVARKFAEQLGVVPSFFAATVRFLKNDQFDNQIAGKPAVRPITKYLACKTFAGNKLLAMYYASTERLKPQKLEESESLTLGRIISFYDPLDVAALFATFYLYRRSLKLVEGNLDALQSVMPELEKESQIGAYVGVAIPKIGIATGLLVGTIHHFPQILFYQSDREKYTSYRAALEAKGGQHSAEIELEYFGCTTLQVASVLLSLIGFGVQVCEQYMAGLSPTLKIKKLDATTPAEKAAQSALYAVKFTRMWIDCAISGQSQPVEQMPGEFYPLTDAREVLNQQVQDVINGAPHWLHCNPEDISPELTPKLFADAKKEDMEIPEQLRDVFSLEEICAMEEEEFDQLVDQLDRDNLLGATPEPSID